jgi:hypothetical protein
LGLGCCDAADDLCSNTCRTGVCKGFGLSSSGYAMHIQPPQIAAQQQPLHGK